MKQSYKTVARNKQHFFSSSSKKPALAVQSIDSQAMSNIVDTNGNLLDSSYYEDHLFWLNQEYKHLSAILEELTAENTADQEMLNAVKERCRYFAEQLLIFAKKYHGPKSTEAQAYQNKISTLLNEKPAPEKPIYFSVAILRDWLNIFNVYRLHIVFSRITWKHFWLMGRELQWLDSSDKIAGVVPVNISIMDAPTAVFNVLSVFFFASRFSINLAMLLKHTFEAKEGISKRFWNELKKRHWIMVNDLVWAIVNALTNYAIYFNIAAMTANWVLAAFLVFDLMWLGYRVYLEEQNYLSTKAYYDYQMYTPDISELDKSILKRQLMQLNNDRHQINGTFGFCIAAALLIMASFAAALLIGSPITLPICFFFCIVAISMYMSSGKFGNYIKELMKENPSNAQQSKAGWDFGLTLIKNALVPLLIIGLFTISWQAAIIMAVLYVGYEIGVNAKTNHNTSKKHTGSLGLFKSEEQPLEQEKLQTPAPN